MPKVATKAVRPVSRREQDKEVRRKAILAAAKKIFAEKGFHSTSVSDIVQEVGIAQGTFYLYFDDKKAIFEEIVDDLLGQFVKFATVRTLEEFKSLADVEHAISKISGPLIAFFRENRDLGKIFLREAVGTGLGFEEKIMEFYDRMAKIGVEYIKHFQKKGLLRAGYDPFVAMTFAIGGAQMVIYRWVTDGFEVPEEEIVKSLTALGLHLFAK